MTKIKQGCINILPRLLQIKQRGSEYSGKAFGKGKRNHPLRGFCRRSQFKLSYKKYNTTLYPVKCWLFHYHEPPCLWKLLSEKFHWVHIIQSPEASSDSAFNLLPSGLTIQLLRYFVDHLHQAN